MVGIPAATSRKPHTSSHRHPLEPYTSCTCNVPALCQTHCPIPRLPIRPSMCRPAALSQMRPRLFGSIHTLQRATQYTNPENRSLDGTAGDLQTFHRFLVFLGTIHCMESSCGRILNGNPTIIAGLSAVVTKASKAKLALIRSSFLFGHSRRIVWIVCW